VPVGFRRVFLGLLRELVRGQMIALLMCNGGSLVSVCGVIVKLGGPVMRALRHVHLLIW
jgi:hypothetical protein